MSGFEIGDAWRNFRTWNQKAEAKPSPDAFGSAAACALTGLAAGDPRNAKALEDLQKLEVRHWRSRRAPLAAGGRFTGDRFSDKGKKADVFLEEAIGLVEQAKTTGLTDETRTKLEQKVEQANQLLTSWTLGRNTRVEYGPANGSYFAAALSFRGLNDWLQGKYGWRLDQPKNWVQALWHVILAEAFQITTRIAVVGPYDFNIKALLGELAAGTGATAGFFAGSKYLHDKFGMPMWQAKLIALLICSGAAGIVSYRAFSEDARGNKGWWGDFINMIRAQGNGAVRYPAALYLTDMVFGPLQGEPL